MNEQQQTGLLQFFKAAGQVDDIGRHFSSQVVLRRYPVNGRLLKRAIGGTGAFNWRTESK
jgi:hypothetical protein